MKFFYSLMLQIKFPKSVIEKYKTIYYNKYVKVININKKINNNTEIKGENKKCLE